MEINKIEIVKENFNCIDLLDKISDKKIVNYYFGDSVCVIIEYLKTTKKPRIKFEEVE